MTCPRGTLSVAWFDIEYCHGQLIARLSVFDEDWASHWVAPGDRGLIAAISGLTNLTGQGIFAFKLNHLSGFDMAASWQVATEFVDQGLCGDKLHGAGSDSGEGRGLFAAASPVRTIPGRWSQGNSFFT
jgi:hypothetical protein